MKTSLRYFFGWLLLHMLAANAPLRAQNLNLAQNKYTFASSQESGNFPINAATDGDSRTRWSSEFNDGQYLGVDLGTVQSIDRVRITWEAASGRDFLLQVSSDGLSWTTVKTVTANNPTDRGGYYLNEYTDLNANGTSIGRYVRFYGSARNTSFGYSIYEFEVFGFTNSAVSLAQNKVSTASDTQQGFSPDMAFDGDDNTRWSTLNGTNQNLDVDFGQNVTISRIYLNWELAYGVNFLLQASNDKVRWTTFATFIGNRALYNEMAVAASGRYVRLLGQDGGQNGGGFSAWEFRIYGTPAPLPVTLASFGAAARGTGVAVNWTTASEQNSASFEVQRGTDGVQFKSIGTVAAAGNSQTTKVYQYFDAAPVRPTSYYRLKQIDLDGRETYGPVAVVRLAGATPTQPLTLYPNPVADQATLQWDAPTAGPGRWTLLTTTGQVVRQGAFESQQGANSQFIDLRSCAAGSYILSVEAAGQPIQRQLVQKVQ
jgi:hypothetical protein